MTTQFDNRTKKFTNAEFSALERNADGDVLELSSAFIWMTKSQSEKLSGDDYSRFDDYQEEMRCMIAELY
jgi:hypothetical protein